MIKDKPIGGERSVAIQINCNGQRISRQIQKSNDLIKAGFYHVFAVYAADLRRTFDFSGFNDLLIAGFDRSFGLRLNGTLFKVHPVKWNIASYHGSEWQ